MASRKAKGLKHGGIGGPKPPAANSAGNASGYVAKAAGFKRGGGIGRGTGMAFGGPAAVKRLDRPGRKRGGGIGADTSPLTSAATLSGSDTGNQGGKYAGSKEDD